jgi:hypothetical protein
LKDYFSSLSNGDEIYRFCCSNWGFLKVFETMLYNLVKAEEITEKFDSLNKQTASKIEKFIRDQIRMLLDAKEIEQKIKVTVKEFEIEFKKRSNEMKAEQQKRRAMMEQELLMDSWSDV